MDEKNPHIGSKLESSLRDDFNEASRNEAIKSVLAYNLSEAMKAQNLSKSAMAKRMPTSCSQLGRLLDPQNEGVILHTLKRAAEAIGMRLDLELRQA